MLRIILGGGWWKKVQTMVVAERCKQGVGVATDTNCVRAAWLGDCWMAVVVSGGGNGEGLLARAGSTIHCMGLARV